MTSKTKWFVSAILCFALHFGLIFHHVYVTASNHGKRAFPLPSKEFTEKNHTTIPNAWHPVLDLNRWDSAHYEVIVDQGYRSEEASKRYFHPIMWYPGYPLMAGFVQRITGLPTTLVFSILSLVFTLTFWILLWSPAMTDTIGVKAMTISSLLIISWPGSYYFFTGMTEPLVCLLLLLILILWVHNRPFHSGIVLAIGTGVKQLFVPVALAYYALNLLKNRKDAIKHTLLLVLSLSGFLAFGLYGFLHFGNFFASSDTCLIMFEKKLNLLSIIDIRHYARHFWKINGITAFAGMTILIGMSPYVLANRPGTPGLAAFLTKKQEALPINMVLWWLALAMTSFFILGDAYGENPFMSMLRFQTTNIPLFLLVGYQMRHHAWSTLLFLLLPITAMFLVWQQSFTILYWGWRWIA